MYQETTQRRTIEAAGDTFPPVTPTKFSRRSTPGEKSCGNGVKSRIGVTKGYDNFILLPSSMATFPCLGRSSVGFEFTSPKALDRESGATRATTSNEEIETVYNSQKMHRFKNLHGLVMRRMRGRRLSLVDSMIPNFTEKIDIPTKPTKHLRRNSLPQLGAPASKTCVLSSMKPRHDRKRRCSLVDSMIRPVAALACTTTISTSTCTSSLIDEAPTFAEIRSDTIADETSVTSSPYVVRDKRRRRSSIAGLMGCGSDGSVHVMGTMQAAEARWKCPWNGGVGVLRWRFGVAGRGVPEVA